MTAIGKLAEDENTVVVPMMIAGFTDSHYFRQVGLDCLRLHSDRGFDGRARAGFTGFNERIGVKALGAGAPAHDRSAEIDRYV